MDDGRGAKAGGRLCGWVPPWRLGAERAACLGRLVSSSRRSRSTSRRRSGHRSTSTFRSPPPAFDSVSRRSAAHQVPGTGSGHGTGRGGQARHHPGELGPERGEPGDLPVDLADVLAQQRLGPTVRAVTGLTDQQQLADLRQPQPEPLGAPDERAAGPRRPPRTGGDPRWYGSAPAAGRPVRSSGSCPLSPPASAASCPTVSGLATR